MESASPQSPSLDRPGRERWLRAYIEVARYSGDVTIELRHLSPEQAANVISMLARQATGTEQ